MKRFVLLALLGLALPAPAEARHCPSGQILRVSMGRCVSARSRMAYGYVRRRSIRYGWRNRHSFYRYREARLRQEEEGQADERERRVRPKPPPAARHRPQMLQVIEPAAIEPPAEIEIPYGIYGSRMMRPQFHRFDWIKP